jgi:hypothetical protein
MRENAGNRERGRQLSCFSAMLRLGPVHRGIESFLHS